MTLPKCKTSEGEYLKDDCSNYDDSKYKNPSVTVDIIIYTIIDKELKVLLIQRKYPPFKDRWAIPGGFVNINDEEDLKDTAARELREETSLINIPIKQLKAYGKPGRDPRKRIITIAYFALVPYSHLLEQKIKGGDDAKKAKWFNYLIFANDIKLAFDHNTILKDSYLKLKENLWTTNIIFKFLPTEFTWNELQEVYEIIESKKYTADNFRRKINKIFKLNKTKKTQATKGRPSTLLTF